MKTSQRRTRLQLAADEFGWAYALGLVLIDLDYAYPSEIGGIRSDLSKLCAYVEANFNLARAEKQEFASAAAVLTAELSGTGSETALKRAIVKARLYDAVTHTLGGKLPASLPMPMPPNTKEFDVN